MVDRMDQGAIPAQVVAQSYEALWKLVSKALYRTHVEGKLKVTIRSPVRGSTHATLCLCAEAGRGARECPSLPRCLRYGLLKHSLLLLWQ